MLCVCRSRSALDLAPGLLLFFMSRSIGGMERFVKNLFSSGCGPQNVNFGSSALFFPHEVNSSNSYSHANFLRDDFMYEVLWIKYNKFRFCVLFCAAIIHDIKRLINRDHIETLNIAISSNVQSDQFAATVF